MMAFSNADVSYARDRISFVPHKRDTWDHKSTHGIYGFLQVTNDPLMNQWFYAECWFNYKDEYSSRKQKEDGKQLLTEKYRTVEIFGVNIILKK